jgi:hypothetical protein
LLQMLDVIDLRPPRRNLHPHGMSLARSFASIC